MVKNNPQVKLPKSKTVFIINLLSLLIMMSSFIYIIVMYNRLPETIPTHYNFAGEADQWGSKRTIFIFPVLMLFMFLLFYFLAKVPHIHNFPFKVTEENAGRVYPLSRLMLVVLNFEIICMFAYLTMDITGKFFGQWFTIVTLSVPIMTIIFFLIALIKAK